MSFKKIVACTVVVSAGLASGCASIVSGGPRTVTISSSPSGVPFVIKNRAGNEVASGTTPSTQALPAKAGFFKGETYAVTYKPQWASEQTRTLNSNLNGWYWGNIIFGGLLGLLIVDPATGAMWTLPPNVAADMPQQPVAPVAQAPVVEQAPAAPAAPVAATN